MPYMRDDSRTPQPLLSRLMWGLRWGLIYCVILSAFAIILRVVDGPTSFVEHGTSLGAFLEAYVAAGVAGGLLLGLTQPWLRSGTGSAVVGAVVGSLVGFALLVSNNGLTDWSGFDLLLPATFALSGCTAGVLLHRKISKKTKL